MIIQVSNYVLLRALLYIDCTAHIRFLCHIASAPHITPYIKYSFDMYVFLCIFFFLYSRRYILYYIAILQVVYKEMIKAYPAH